ncbi:hypothetical protein ABZ826_12150 [Streptomyces sp. NPDC047515]|uniref:hypothetical protein n=1 Tax=Streptomyces sp. NPDC047515 TaxID=3155380 RepID=UPI0033CB48A8
MLLDDAAAASPSECLGQFGLTPEPAERLRVGAQDAGVIHCRDPFDSPFSAPGRLCAVAPLRFLECRNAWTLPSKLPQLLLLSDHLEAMRRRLSPVHFHTLWKHSAASLVAVLAHRTDQEIAPARRHIADGGVSLRLPLTARAEFTYEPTPFPLRAPAPCSPTTSRRRGTPESGLAVTSITPCGANFGTRLASGWCRVTERPGNRPFRFTEEHSRELTHREQHATRTKHRPDPRRIRRRIRLEEITAPP